MQTRTLDVTPLRAAFAGALIQPGDPGYDEARRIWNGAIDRHPALVARCTGVADVLAAVRFAREENLLVAVRGGGHNVAGTAVCDGGLVIDLSPMKGMRVDPARRIAWAQPGLLWGEFDRETQVFGLAAPGGIVTHTGVAGLTLGGGIGWLMRKYGLSCDNVRAFDVVLADGRVVRASADEHPDLFWGLRGGGGNFGVVTSFEFALHPVGPTVLAGTILHPAADAPEVLRAYREFAAGAPDDLTTIVSLRRAPALPAIPEHLHGEPVVAINVCWAGPIAEGERALAPLRALGHPLADLIQPKAYTAHQGTFDRSVPHGLGYYWKSHYLAELSDAAIATLAAHAWRAGSAWSYSLLFQMGGAIRRAGEHETAFGNRDAAFALNINAVWTDPAGADAEIAWCRAFWSAIAPDAMPAAYMNFLGEEGEERVRAAYGAENYARLVALKNRYDPANFFRVNQNIRPTA